MFIFCLDMRFSVQNKYIKIECVKADNIDYGAKYRDKDDQIDGQGL